MPTICGAPPNWNVNFKHCVLTERVLLSELGTEASRRVEVWEELFVHHGDGRTFDAGPTLLVVDRYLRQP